MNKPDHRVNLKIESNFELPENIISDVTINFTNNSKVGYRVIVDIRIQELMAMNIAPRIKLEN